MISSVSFPRSSGRIGCISSRRLTFERKFFRTRSSVLRVKIKQRSGLPGCGHIAAELRDECLNQEVFYSLKEAQVVIGQWRKHYNTIRPHSALNYRPPAPQTFAPSARHLGSGLIDHSQKMTMAAMQIADMKVWAHRS